MSVTSEPTIVASIIGGSGFVGAELLRWLVDHPHVHLHRVTSRSQAGRPLEAVHRGLPPTGLQFEELGSQDAASGADIVFLATPTRASARLADELASFEGRIIDLSAAHRFDDPTRFEEAYGFAHPSPGRLGSYCYGLVELDPPLAGARRVAAPGCFATATILSVLPVWKQASTVGPRLRVVGLTGSSGSGATPTPRTHHPIRSTNVSPYRVLHHRHAPEIESALRAIRRPEPAVAPVTVDFVPVSVPIARGISTTTFVDLPPELPSPTVDGWFSACYQGRSLVRVLGAQGRSAEVAAVKGSMFADISWARSKCGCTLAVTVAIDNLAKGGAGQAVQCMNLMWGLPADTGLRRPALWP